MLYNIVFLQKMSYNINFFLQSLHLEWHNFCLIQLASPVNLRGARIVHFTVTLRIRGALFFLGIKYTHLAVHSPERFKNLSAIMFSVPR